MARFNLITETKVMLYFRATKEKSNYFQEK